MDTETYEDRQTDRQRERPPKGSYIVPPHINGTYAIVCISFENFKVGLSGFLVVFEVPELYRKLREACRKNFCYILCKSTSVVPSYGPKPITTYIKRIKTYVKLIKTYIHPIKTWFQDVKAPLSRTIHFHTGNPCYSCLYYDLHYHYS